jgi:hypothetical protein
MMACMIFKDRVDITPYYAVPEKYTTIPREQETVAVKKIVKLPEYKIQTPPDNLIKCLEIIHQWKNYRISNNILTRLIRLIDILSAVVGEKQSIPLFNS